MNSGGSSSFWFQQDETPGWETEIDVFEIGGKAKGFEKKYNMTVHRFPNPDGEEALARRRGLGGTLASR